MPEDEADYDIDQYELNRDENNNLESIRKEEAGSITIDNADETLKHIDKTLRDMKGTTEVKEHLVPLFKEKVNSYLKKEDINILKGSSEDVEDFINNLMDAKDMSARLKEQKKKERGMKPREKNYLVDPEKNYFSHVDSLEKLEKIDKNFKDYVRIVKGELHQKLGKELHKEGAGGWAEREAEIPEEFSDILKRKREELEKYVEGDKQGAVRDWRIQQKHNKMLEEIDNIEEKLKEDLEEKRKELEKMKVEIDEEKTVEDINKKDMDKFLEKVDKTQKEDEEEK